MRRLLHLTLALVVALLVLAPFPVDAQEKGKGDLEYRMDLVKRMDPDKKAQLVVAVYQLYSEAGASPEKATILKLVRSAA